MKLDHIVAGLLAGSLGLMAGCASTPDDGKRSGAVYSAPEPVLGSSLLRRDRRSEDVKEVKGDAAIEELRRLPTGGAGRSAGN